MSLIACLSSVAVTENTYLNVNTLFMVDMQMFAGFLSCECFCITKQINISIAVLLDEVVPILGPNYLVPPIHSVNPVRRGCRMLLIHVLQSPTVFQP